MPAIFFNALLVVLIEVIILAQFMNSPRVLYEYVPMYYLSTFSHF